MRTSAEMFPVGEFIREEMDERGLSLTKAHALLGNDPARCCAFDLAAYANDPDLIMDATTAADVALVLGGTAIYWMNIDRGWREAMNARKTLTPTESPLE